MEIITAGTAMATEFQKNGRRPLQSTPVQALDHAVPQADHNSAAGQGHNDVLRISSSSFERRDQMALQRQTKKAVARPYRIHQEAAP